MDEIKKFLHKTPTGKLWEKVGIFPHHGINLPLSALHTKKSCGIGEFFDLIPLIDWCKEVKMDLIQLLPLNDSGNDPSPYNALSSCGFNPIFLSLHALPFVEKLPDLQKKIGKMQLLTQSQRIPYHEVKIQKLYWLHLYFTEVGKRLMKEEEYVKFIAANAWAEPYALFKVLKDILEQSVWNYWPDELKNPSKEIYDALIETYHTEISFHLFLQYLCHLQFTQVKAHAEKREILIKGDIPILISPDSVDVWHHPEFFDLSLAAGAPPDPYSAEQQYWGFPVFRWEANKKSHYSWWKQRLDAANHFFDLYRIDHVVGLFRLWAIPLGQPTVKGRFIPEDESQWIPQGKEILRMMISHFPMLPLAEDLGHVPPAVKQCLHDLGIPGTKVMRWQRLWDENKQFIPYDDYPPLSLTCVSTHDSPTLAQWWKEEPDEAEAFATFKGWKYKPLLSQEERKEILYDSHHTPSLFHINLLQEYLALFPDLIWTNPADERINIPGKILPTNWTYRFRPSVEELVSHEPLKQQLREIL